MREILKNRVFLFLAAIFLVGIAVGNVVWLRQDRVPPEWDQSSHLNICLNYKRFVQTPVRFSAHSFRRFMDITHYYPPFFHLSTVPVTVLLGFSPDTVALTHLAYLAVLVFSLYGIGRYFQKPEAGAAAGLIMLLSPLVYGLSREAVVEVPLTAMVALTLFLLFKSSGGLDIKWSWLLGLAMGFAFMTKWTAVIFVLGPAIFVFWDALKSKKISPKTGPLSLACCFVIVLVITYPWYSRAFSDFFKVAKASNVLHAAREGDPRPFSPAAFNYYFQDFKKVIFPDVLAAIVLAGLICFFIWGKNRRALGFLLCWVVPAYIIFVGIPNKDVRFILPLVPGFALGAALGIMAIPLKLVRNAVWVLFLCLGVLKFFMSSFGWPMEGQLLYSRPPLRQDWKIEEILASLKNQFKSPSVTVAVLPDLPYFNHSNFSFYANLAKLPFSIEGIGDLPVEESQLEEMDVLIIKTGPIAVPWTQVHRVEFVKRLRSEGLRNFKLKFWESFPLPDGSHARVFLKKRQPKASLKNREALRPKKSG